MFSTSPERWSVSIIVLTLTICFSTKSLCAPSHNAYHTAGLQPKRPDTHPQHLSICDMGSIPDYHPSTNTSSLLFVSLYQFSLSPIGRVPIHAFLFEVAAIISNSSFATQTLPITIDFVYGQLKLSIAASRENITPEAVRLAVALASELVMVKGVVGFLRSTGNA